MTTKFSTSVTVTLYGRAPNDGTRRTEQRIEGIVDLVVDDAALFDLLGPKAMHNKGARSTALKGAIVAEVRPGSKRTIET